MNTITCCDCVEGMPKLPSNSIPLTVTSPAVISCARFRGVGLRACGRWTRRSTKDGGLPRMAI